MIRGQFPQLLNKKDGSVGQATNRVNEIRLKSVTAPVKYRVRLVPVQLRYELKVCNDSRLARSIIRTSKSEWAAPIMLVRRIDGSIWVCVNYSDLINATVKDAYPMPNIDYLVYRLHQLKIATIFDLIVGFNRVEKLETHSRSVLFNRLGTFRVQCHDCRPHQRLSKSTQQTPHQHQYDERSTWKRKRQMLLSIIGWCVDIARL